ncbi:MAG: DUF2784 domain-containing protein [Gammaproteobacteria bacterium]|nr:DUF2784 domain-containing protein [Gammaproteobacteria bacterium]MDE0366291.1 DUF2784 domain-containing protein [Gammaproteobacteria bacterium]
MGYRLAADTMMVAHLLYIVFVVVGGLIAFRARWILWLHIPAVAWAIYVQYIGRVCPLTTWEKEFRDLAGDAGYDGGFIDHYIIPIIYPPDMTIAMHLVLGTLVILVNGGVYAALIAQARRAQGL